MVNVPEPALTNSVAPEIEPGPFKLYALVVLKVTKAGCGVPATVTGTLFEPVLSNVRVSPLLKIVSTLLVLQLSAPLTSQMFAAPSPSQISDLGVMTIPVAGVALASGEFGPRPLALVEATTK